jgi:putative chitinase
MAAQLLLPAIKALASGGLKKAAMGAAKGAVKGKAKDFVTGKKRKGKGKGDALAKSEGGGEEQVEDGKGGTIVPITPMVGNYKVETLPDKPDEVGKPSKVSYETINNQLDSIIGLTNALKKTSAVKLKNDENRRKAERKASEKAKKRQRESLLERGAGKALGMAGNLYGKATKGFDPLNFFTQIFLGSLFNWITTNGSKIIGFLKVGLALFNNAGKLLKSGFKFLGKVLKSGFKLIAKLPKAIKGIAKGVGKSILGVGRKLGSVFGKIGKSLKNLIKGLLSKIPGFPKPPTPRGPKPKKPGSKPGSKPGKPGGKPTGPKPGKPGGKPTGPKPGKPGGKPTGPKPGKPGGKPGSQLLKGGVGRSTNRMIAKVGGKNALRFIKNLKGGLSRIPIIGPLITLIVSVISGDPIEQTMFKTGGAVLGGFLGTFILPPPLGTLVGEILGEYIGDLFYVLTKGDEGGARAVGKKIQADILDPIVNAGTVAMDWVGNGFGRMYEGIPKLNILGFGEIPNPLWMANPFNIVEKAGVVGKAFFTDKPMKKGEVKKKGKVDSNEPDGVTNMSTVTTVKPERAGDFVMNSAGQLRVFDGLGYSGATPEQQKMYESGATNIDGTKPKISSGGGGVYGSEHIKNYAQKNGFTDPTELAMFMAQMGHESGSFRYATEIASGSDYEGVSILGNTQPGDGKRFKGRGYVQLTGRWNYGHYGKMIGVDLVNNPELAADPDVAAKIAIAYWKDRVDRKAARNGDVLTVTKNINGGTNGLKDRERRFNLYMKGQTPSGDVKGSSSSPQMSSLQSTSTAEKSEGEPIIESQDTNPSDGLESSETTPAATPAQVSPSTSSQTQMSNGITGISQQLSYEESGNTVVMMQGSGGQQTPMSSGGGKGTPVMMGSGDVVNSYYKSQLMGFLYKQG